MASKKTKGALLTLTQRMKAIVMMDRRKSAYEIREE